MKRFQLFLLCVSIIFALCACATGTDEPVTENPAAENPAAGDTAQAEPAQTYLLSFTTGSSGGSFYSIGAGIASLVTEKSEMLTITAEAGGGSHENCNLVGTGEADFGFAANDVVLEAYEGAETFDGVAYTDLRFVMATFNQPYQVVTLADSPITNITDFVGRSIHMGTEGAPTTSQKFITTACGLVMNVDFKGQHMPHTQGAQALVDGKVEAEVVQLGIPSSAIAEMAVTHDIKLIQLTDEQLNNLFELSDLYVPFTIPAGTYSGVDYDVYTAASPVLIIANVNVPDEAVYEFIDRILANTDELAAINASAAGISLETATESMVIPLHSGAQKYYEDKGIL